MILISLKKLLFFSLQFLSCCVALQIHEKHKFHNKEETYLVLKWVFFNLDSSRLHFPRLRLNSRERCLHRQSLEHFSFSWEIRDSIKKYQHICAIWCNTMSSSEGTFACGYVFDRGPKENTIGRTAREGLKTTGPGWLSR